MFARTTTLVGYCASLILVVLSTSMPARSRRGKQSSPGDTNAPPAQAEAHVITVWKVGSPWTGDTPDTAVSPRLDLAARHLGYSIKIQAFPARSFASALFRAFEANRPPDVLAFDNICILRLRHPAWRGSRNRVGPRRQCRLAGGWRVSAGSPGFERQDRDRACGAG